MGGLYTFFNNHTWFFYIFFIAMLLIAIFSGVQLTGDNNDKSYTKTQKAGIGLLFYIVFLNASILSNVFASNLIISSKDLKKSSKVDCLPNDPTCKIDK